MLYTFIIGELKSGIVVSKFRAATTYSQVYKKTEASVSHLKEERNRSEEFVMETSNDGVQGHLQGTQASPFISKTDSLSAGDPLHMKVYEEEMDQDESEEIRRDLPGDDVPVLSSSSTREVG